MNFWERAGQAKWQPEIEQWKCFVQKNCTHANKTLQGIGKHIEQKHKTNHTIKRKCTMSILSKKIYMNLEPLLIHNKLKNTKAKWRPCNCPSKPKYISQKNSWKTLYATHHNTNKYITPITPMQISIQESTSETSEDEHTTESESIHIKEN